MRKILATLLIAATVTLSQAVSASQLLVADHHTIKVIDGDTIQIDDGVYQLAGIDAPELGQACDHKAHLWLCGLAAGAELRKLIDLQTMPIKCFVQQRPRMLAVATCLIGDNEISDILLKGGYVVALANGIPHYTALQHLAKNSSLGIWGSNFIMPDKWRLGGRLANEHTFKGSSHPTKEFPWQVLEKVFLNVHKAGHVACMVKGKISGNKERFYFGPLDAEYESITINPQSGERYFCGDDEARQAGWIRQGESSQKSNGE